MLRRSSPSCRAIRLGRSGRSDGAARRLPRFRSIVSRGAALRQRLIRFSRPVGDDHIGPTIFHRQLFGVTRAESNTLINSPCFYQAAAIGFLPASPESYSYTDYLAVGARSSRAAIKLSIPAPLPTSTTCSPERMAPKAKGFPACRRRIRWMIQEYHPTTLQCSLKSGSESARRPLQPPPGARAPYVEPAKRARILGYYLVSW